MAHAVLCACTIVGRLAFMADGPYRQGAADLAERRCLFCGGAVDEATNACSLCSSEAAPRSRVGEELALSCPRCHVPMYAVHLAKVVVSQCPECCGCFVAASDWSELVTRMCAGDGELGAFVPPPPGKGLPAERRVVMCMCPVCGKEMERAQFGARTPIAIDVCMNHGDWFDAAELVSCAQYAKAREARGNVASAEERADEQAWARQMAQAQRQQDLEVAHVATLSLESRLLRRRDPLVASLSMIDELLAKK